MRFFILTERVKSAYHTNSDDLVNHARKLERERDEANESSEAFSALAWKLEGERNEALNKLAKITKAAEAVIDRWEQPAWKDTEPTGAVIYRLRDALGRDAE